MVCRWAEWLGLVEVDQAPPRGGLVPITLSSMTRSQAVFRPTEAHQVMDKLYVSQQARHRWRNRHAEELHSQHHLEHTAQSGRPGTPATEDVPETEEAITDVPPASAASAGTARLFVQQRRAP